MNYLRIYTNLINTRVNRLVEKDEYYERHHIKPKCLGGDNQASNLVFLSPEEHLLAHLLLVKIHPQESKLLYAANLMKNRVHSNKEYGWVKRRYAIVNSADRIGKARSVESCSKQSATILNKYANGYQHPMKGIPLTDEHKRKISESNKGKQVNEQSKSSLVGYQLRYGEAEGLKRYQEDCLKKDSMSMPAFIRRHGQGQGTILYEARQAQMRLRVGKHNSFYGKHHTPETITKLKEKASMRPKSTCPHCGKIGSAPLMKRWHFANCKKKGK